MPSPYGASSFAASFATIFAGSTISHPTRAIGAAFQPDPTGRKWAFVTYTFRIGASVTVPPLTGTATTTGRIDVKSDAANPPTDVIAPVRNSQSATHTLTVSLGLTLGQDQDPSVSFWVPPGHWVLFTSVSEAGAPTFSVQQSTERLFG